MNDESRTRFVSVMLCGASVLCAASCAGKSDRGAPGAPSAPPPMTTTTLTPAATSVPSCGRQPAQVTSNVTKLTAGGGALAYVKDAKLFVLPAAETTAIEVGLSANPMKRPKDIVVDGENVGWSDWGHDASTPETNGEAMVVVDYRSGTTRDLGRAYFTQPLKLDAHRAFWWGTETGEVWSLWAAGADGSTPRKAIAQSTVPGMVFPKGDTVAWTDQDNVLHTLAAGSDASTTHVKMPEGFSALDGTTGYAGGSGRILAVPIDGAEPTELATMLPPHYPGVGAPSPAGEALVVVGPKRVFWAECWGNGGAAPNGSGAALVNWVLRAVAPTGGTPETIDSFTWDPRASTSGACPTIAADGSAVYWTREGTLMRLCE